MKTMVFGLVAMTLMSGSGAEPWSTPETLIADAPGPQRADTQSWSAIGSVDTADSVSSASSDGTAPGLSEHLTPTSATDPAWDVHANHDIRYASSGTDVSEYAEPGHSADAFNLHMRFATPDTGERLSTVQVTIFDIERETVLSVTSTGPWFFARLPQGDYSIDVTPTGFYGEGETLRKGVQIDGSSPARLDFHWQECRLSLVKPAGSVLCRLGSLLGDTR